MAIMDNNELVSQPSLEERVLALEALVVSQGDMVKTMAKLIISLTESNQRLVTMVYEINQERLKSAIPILMDIKNQKN